MELGCWSFVAASTTSLLSKMGVRGHSLQQAIKSLLNGAEKKRHQLGSEMKTGGHGVEGGAPGMPGVTVEPSGDVVSSSTKHP